MMLFWFTEIFARRDLSDRPRIGPHSISLLRGSVMFGPFYSTAMLTLESYNVIGLRLAKLMSGGRDAVMKRI
jgi:hypothetical protein